MCAVLKTVTLGCKVNQYETQYVREALLGIGYRDARHGEYADLCIVNTCTVTATGDAKSRQVIRRLGRDHPGTRIVVMGCYATREPEQVAALPGVVDVVTDKRELPDLLQRFGVAHVPNGISAFSNRHRAYVKVQDGCMLRCSFCIVPHVRPNLASRPVEQILAEVRRLVDGGYREIVLTGIHLGHYGVDWNRRKPKQQWVRLSDLVRHITVLDGDFRIRLSSIEATEVTRELIAAMCEFPEKICPHLHISMQSGSDAVLQRMRRRWGSQRFLDRCHKVREALDRPGLTTDVMVGFPGETDVDFQATCRAVHEAGFFKIHVFPFSPRPGTHAANMPDQVPHHVKMERARQLVSVECRLRDRYFASLAQARLRVLAESAVRDRPGRLVGTACRYAPVELPGGDSLQGQLVDVIAGTVSNGRIVGVRPRFSFSRLGQAGRS